MSFIASRLASYTTTDKTPAVKLATDPKSNISRYDGYPIVYSGSIPASDSGAADMVIGVFKDKALPGGKFGLSLNFYQKDGSTISFASSTSGLPALSPGWSAVGTQQGIDVFLAMDGSTDSSSIEVLEVTATSDITFDKIDIVPKNNQSIVGVLTCIPREHKAGSITPVLDPADITPVVNPTPISPFVNPTPAKPATDNGSSGGFSKSEIAAFVILAIVLLVGSIFMTAMIIRWQKKNMPKWLFPFALMADAEM